MRGEKIVAHNFKGKRYDIGNKIGLLKANIEFGLRNPETSADLKESSRVSAASGQTGGAGGSLSGPWCRFPRAQSPLSSSRSYPKGPRVLREAGSHGAPTAARPERFGAGRSWLDGA